MGLSHSNCSSVSPLIPSTPKLKESLYNFKLAQALCQWWFQGGRAIGAIAPPPLNLKRIHLNTLFVIKQGGHQPEIPRKSGIMRECYLPGKHWEICMIIGCNLIFCYYKRVLETLASKTLGNYWGRKRPMETVTGRSEME